MFCYLYVDQSLIVLSDSIFNYLVKIKVYSFGFIWLFNKIFINVWFRDMYLYIFFLVMSVCEGSLGLSILVMLIRSHGNDFLPSLNLLW